MRRERVVAKFGGSSMADPSLVVNRIESMETNPIVIVVSAAGIDKDYPTKMTDTLLAYEASRAKEVRCSILDRLGSIAIGAGLKRGVVEAYTHQASKDIDHFLSHSYPLAALGERWSAKLLARLTGRQYLEASKVIQFKNNSVDVGMSVGLLRQNIEPHRSYIMPGFYGAADSGEIQTFDRGGSDVSGALCALALRAQEYQNWSDVDGFYTADPRVISNAVPIPELTYREARELANGGSELLHREVGRHLAGSRIPTRMFSTMSGMSRTNVTDHRDASKSILLGVSGMRNMVKLSHDEFGSEERSGTTLNLYEALREHNIPYIHSATSTDTVSVYIDGAFEDETRAVFAGSRVEEVAALHIVGQGLADLPLNRTRLLGDLATILAEQKVALRGFTDAGCSPATTLFISKTDYSKALELVHDFITDSSLNNC